MKKILIYSPNPIDGVSFYRQWGPMSAMRSEYSLFAFPNDPRELQLWTWYKGYDLAFMSRPHRPTCLYFVQECKKWGIPVWIDYDDALLQIPDDNPVAKTFQGDAVKYTTEALKAADVVSTASTLQKKWFEDKLGLKNVVFIPNAVDDAFLKYKMPHMKSNKILWRGSDSHLRDLLEFSEDLTGIIGRHDYKWLFFGINPFFLINKQTESKINWHPTINQIDFIREICAYNARFQVVPLVDHFFNRVKSNLAWLDGTLAGSVCIVPKWEAWDVPGVIYYSDNSIRFALAQAFSKLDSELEAMHVDAWTFIKDNLLLSKVNNLRREIIANLTG